MKVSVIKKLNSKSDKSIASSNKKAFIFSLEMTFAVFLVTTILLVASYYSSKQTDDPFAKLQVLRLGEDIIAVMDYSNTLTTFNTQAIHTQLDQLLPVNYQMKITINGTFSENGGYIETNQSLPTDRFIIAGNRIIVKSDASSFGVVKYYMWLR